jgi:ankyrin repeat protein
MVDCLIAHGCKISNANLSMSENTELIERLVKSGANPKTIDINYALDDRAKLKRLLALKPSLVDIQLDMEVLMSDNELFDLLLSSGMSPNVKGKFPNECPIIFSAIMYGNMHAFKKLYEKGADLKENCRYGFAETPFQAAIYYQQIEFIVFLLDHKISSNEKDWTGKSALILACNTDNDQIINLLLDKGAELEYSSYFGNTPLMYSVQYQHYISAETLIKRKANVNFTSKYGETALTLAIANNDYAMIKLLVESGANPKIKYEDKNLVEYAQEKEVSPAVVQYLKNLLAK